MCSRIEIITLFFVLLSTLGLAQDCQIKLEGLVTDKGTRAPLSFVNVILQELGKGAITDDDGAFVVENICPGHYHLIVSHIGCEPVEVHLDIDRDTILNISLSHTSVSLEGVIVQGKSNDFSNQPNQSIGKQAIEDNSDEHLSGLLKNETGVHLLKNGGGIAKPVVHGMFGNRLTILNNGVPQSGQQWGNDHSPEIDPSAANKITIIKGTSALEYAGGNLGSIVLVESQQIGRDPHLHGRVNYSYETNGRGNNINVQLQKYSSALAWRINGSLKKYGDRKSPSYLLNNTGTEEANLSLQLEKSWKEKTFLELYSSTFNTNLGIMSGSHIGNLTDLEAALSRDVPFNTESEFSNIIEAPKQTVGHHLIKLNAKHYFDDHQSFQFTIAGQLNDRKEFDRRRGGRTNIPALSLQQYAFNSDLKYLKTFKKDLNLKVGIQNTFTDNTNNPETGILPLIPDYNSIETGFFTTLTKSWIKTAVFFGIRYDYERQQVVALSRTVPIQILRYDNKFHNVSGTAGITYDLTKNHSLAFNAGYAMRNPAVNELYSSGLHQGVSGIEEGDVDLKTEKAGKATLEYTAQWGSRFSFGALAYYQRFADYIFLNPQDEVRLTIRGAFPVFKFEQANAAIYGIDMSSKFSIGKALAGQLKYSFIQGDNLSQSIPLVNIPPGSLFGSLTYRLNKPLPIGKINIEDFEFEVNNKFVFKQNHLLPEQDFVLPPGAYTLLGAKASTNVILRKYKLRIFVKVDNLLNTTYRDYLNRQRYFADDLGISATLGINFKF